MDLETLKREAARLSRKADLVTRDGSGAPVAWCYEPPTRGIQYAISRSDGTLLVRPNGKGSGSASVEASVPRGGVPLYASPVGSLPPIEAIFAFGGDEIGAWLAECQWDRSWGFNDNFGDAGLVHDYESWWQSHHPFYTGQGVAMLGGWHFVWPDDDWHDLIDSELVFWTLRGEPWVEVWCTDGQCRVVERVT